MIQDRIAQLISALGLNVNSFANRIGAKQPAIQGIVATRGSQPSWATLEKILTALPDVSAEWLTRGIEPMFLDEEMQKAHEAALQVAASLGGNINQVGSGKLRVSARAGHDTSTAPAELAQVRAALDKCQEDKDRLSEELRKSKDKIIDLLEKR